MVASIFQKIRKIFRRKRDTTKEDVIKSVEEAQRKAEEEAKKKKAVQPSFDKPISPRGTTYVGEDTTKKAKIQAEIFKESQHKTAEVVSGGTFTLRTSRPTGKATVETREIPEGTLEIRKEEFLVTEKTLQSKPVTKLEVLEKQAYEATPPAEKFITGFAVGAGLGAMGTLLPPVGVAMGAAGAGVMGVTTGKAIAEKSLEPFKPLLEPMSLGLVTGGLAGGGAGAGLKTTTKTVVIQPPKGKAIIEPVYGWREVTVGKSKTLIAEAGEARKFAWGVTAEGWMKGRPQLVSKDVLPTLAKEAGKGEIKKLEVPMTVKKDIILTEKAALVTKDYFSYKLIYDPVKAATQTGVEAGTRPETYMPLYYVVREPKGTAFTLKTPGDVGITPVLDPRLVHKHETGLGEMKTTDVKQYLETKTFQKLIPKQETIIEPVIEPTITPTITTTTTKTRTKTTTYSPPPPPPPTPTTITTTTKHIPQPSKLGLPRVAFDGVKKAKVEKFYTTLKERYGYSPSVYAQYFKVGVPKDVIPREIVKEVFRPPKIHLGFEKMHKRRRRK